MDANGPFQFSEGSELVISVHNEALTIAAMCIRNKDGSPLAIDSCDTAQLHPALLRLSALISQYFTGAATFSDYSKRFAAQI